MKKSLSKKIIFCLGFLTASSLILSHSLSRAQGSSKGTPVKRVKYTSQDLPDPFKSPFEREEAVGEPTVTAGLPHLEVQGMVWGSKMPQAIINNTVVTAGEVIEGAEIIDIRKEGVYVLYEENQYILRPAISK